MPDIFDIAHAHIQSGEYEAAFQLLCQTAHDRMQTAAVRADAFQFLGTLVQIAPALADGDESGLSYYQKALEIVPNHLWGAMGVLSGFGYGPCEHQDTTAFLAADSIIRSQWEQLDVAARNQVDRQRRTFESK